MLHSKCEGLTPKHPAPWVLNSELQRSLASSCLRQHQDFRGRRQQFSTESYRHLEAEPSTVRTLAFFAASLGLFRFWNKTFYRNAGEFYLDLWGADWAQNLHKTASSTWAFPGINKTSPNSPKPDFESTPHRQLRSNQKLSVMAIRLGFVISCKAFAAGPSGSTLSCQKQLNPRCPTNMHQGVQKTRFCQRQRLKLPEEQTELPMADHAGNPTRGIAHRWLLCVWIVGFIGGLACGVWLEVWHSKNCRRSL